MALSQPAKWLKLHEPLRLRLQVMTSKNAQRDKPLWCAVPNARQGNAVVGMCEEATFIGNYWAKVRHEQQIQGWFGKMPDFLPTLDAGYADQCLDASFCSLVEHELYYTGQAKDAFGAPRGLVTLSWTAARRPNRLRFKRRRRQHPATS